MDPLARRAEPKPPAGNPMCFGADIPAPPNGAPPMQLVRHSGDQDQLLDMLGGHLRLLSRVIEERPSRNCPYGYDVEQKLIETLRYSGAPLSSYWLRSNVPMSDGWVSVALDVESKAETSFLNVGPKVPEPVQSFAVAPEEVQRQEPPAEETISVRQPNAANDDTESIHIVPGKALDITPAPAEDTAASDEARTESPKVTFVGLNVPHADVDAPEKEITEVTAASPCQKPYEEDRSPPPAVRQSTMRSSQARKTKMRQETSLGPAGRFRMHVGTFVASKSFEYIMGMVIFLNAIMLGVQADLQAEVALDGEGSSAEAPLEVFKYIGILFTLIFAIELILRVISDGLYFFTWSNHCFHWNVFDMVVVFTSATDDIFRLLASESGTDMFDSTSFFRLLRLTRLIRAVRIVRIFRFFRDLRIIVTSIMFSAKSLFWAILLLIIMMFVFAVGILELASERLDEGSELKDFYSGIAQTMYTLYLSIVGGIDWGDAAQPLFDLSPLLGLFYSIYIAFAMLCVLNIVTGVFVENAAKMVEKDEEHMILEELSNREQWYNDIRRIFLESDEDESGEMDWQEFERNLSDPRIQAYFKKVGLDVESQNAHGLFQLLDFDGDGSVDLDEFVTCLQQIQGPAKSIDVVRVRHDVKKCVVMLKQLEKHFSNDMDPQNKKKEEKTKKGPTPKDAKPVNTKPIEDGDNGTYFDPVVAQ